MFDNHVQEFKYKSNYFVKHQNQENIKREKIGG
jgi:hypothetical protein